MDGQNHRVLNRVDTWNATSNRWAFPQTPARVQLSLWAGGLPTNGEGTISWAGGLVDWNSPLMTNGYYSAEFQSVTMSCYNATSPPGTNTGVSYTYNSVEGTNNTVVDGDKPTVLSSLDDSGLDMTAGSPASSSGSSPSGTSTPQTIPGVSGGSTPNGAGAPPGGAAPDSSGDTGSTGTGFEQGTGSSSSGSSSKNGAVNVGPSQEKVLKGSLFAGIIAMVGMMAL